MKNIDITVRRKGDIWGFSHIQLLKHGLDNDDALILRSLKDLFGSIKIENIIINDVRYMWVNKRYFYEYLRIIGSDSKIKRRLSDLEKKGYIKNEILYERKGKKGTFAYMTLTEKVDELEHFDYKVNEKNSIDEIEEKVIDDIEDVENKPFDTPGQNELGGVGQNELGGRSKQTDKDSTIKDSTIDIDHSFIQEKERRKENIDNIVDENERKELQEIIDNSYSKDFKEKDTIEYAIKMLYYTDRFLKIDNMNVPTYEVRQNLKSIDYSVIEAALSDYREAAKEKSIKHPVKYFSKCLYHAIINSDFKITSELLSDGLI